MGDRGRAQHGRHRPAFLVAAVASAALGASCASGDPVEARTDHSGAPSTTTDSATSSTSTSTTVDPQDVLAALPACSEMPPAQDVAWEYTTLPDWVPEGLGDGFELIRAETYGPPTDVATEQPSSTRWLLAQLDGDEVVATIGLLRGGAGSDGYGQPGFSEVTEERTLDSVRGRPGRISRWVNRGDPVGGQVAKWSEDGEDWVATSELGVDELAAALASLSIDGAEVDDPTGRFEVVGRIRTDPSDDARDSRLTSLMVSDEGLDGAPTLHHAIRIEERPSGLEGLMGAMVQPGSRLVEVDGRPAVRSLPEATTGAATFLTTTLSDGSPVTVTWYFDGPIGPDADQDTIDATDASLREVVSSLRRRTPADDGVVAEMISRAEQVGPLEGFCVER